MEIDYLLNVGAKFLDRLCYCYIAALRKRHWVSLFQPLYRLGRLWIHHSTFFFCRHFDFLRPPRRQPHIIVVSLQKLFDISYVRQNITIIVFIDIFSDRILLETVRIKEETPFSVSTTTGCFRSTPNKTQLASLGPDHFGQRRWHFWSCNRTVPDGPKSCASRWWKSYPRAGLRT